MILIISKERLEQSTEEVIDWLDFFNAKYLRINGDDFEECGKIKILIDSKEPVLKYKNKNIPFSKINAVWFRRWSDGLFKKSFFEYKEDIGFGKDLFIYQNSNNQSLKNFFLLY